MRGHSPLYPCPLWPVHGCYIVRVVNDVSRHGVRCVCVWEMVRGRSPLCPFLVLMVWGCCGMCVVGDGGHQVVRVVCV